MRFLTPGLALTLALLVISACAAGPQQRSATAQPGGRLDGTQPEQPSKARVSARQLLGQTDAWLVAHLGAPVFKRADREANIWQYKNDRCLLNVFLYADETGSNAPMRVLHFDARDTNGHNADREQCLSALQD